MKPVTSPKRKIFSIGHSSHTWNLFFKLIKTGNITAVADVRSVPRSRRFPHFNQTALAARLNAEGVSYFYLGGRLGGRPSSSRLTTDGHPDYEMMARTPSFAEGIRELLRHSAQHRLALMCAEAEPAECHRFHLVGRRLVDMGVSVGHILKDGHIEDHHATEERLLAAHRSIRADDLFTTRAEQLAGAYRAPVRRISRRKPMLPAPSPGTRRSGR